jgi:hypothetical protein
MMSTTLTFTLLFLIIFGAVGFSYESEQKWLSGAAEPYYVVMLKARPQAASRPKPSRGSPGRFRPSRKAQAACGLGLVFSKPKAWAQAAAWVNYVCDFY